MINTLPDTQSLILRFIELVISVPLEYLILIKMHIG
jgi:hypothetical protein